MRKKDLSCLLFCSLLVMTACGTTTSSLEETSSVSSTLIEESSLSSDKGMDDATTESLTHSGDLEAQYKAIYLTYKKKMMDKLPEYHGEVLAYKEKNADKLGETEFQKELFAFIQDRDSLLTDIAYEGYAKMGELGNDDAHHALYDIYYEKLEAHRQDAQDFLMKEY